jgi:hypothetical protein
MFKKKKRNRLLNLSNSIKQYWLAPRERKAEMWTSVLCLPRFELMLLDVSWSECTSDLTIKAMCSQCAELSVTLMKLHGHHQAYLPRIPSTHSKMQISRPSPRPEHRARRAAMSQLEKACTMRPACACHSPN